jgi:hypothetical protein
MRAVLKEQSDKRNRARSGFVVPPAATAGRARLRRGGMTGTVTSGTID